MAILHTLVSFCADYAGVALPYVVSAAVLVFTYVVFRDERPYRGIPIVGMTKGKFGLRDYTKARLRYERAAKELFHFGTKEHGGKPFQVLSPAGYKVVIPPRYLEDIKNNENMSFVGFIEHDFFSHVPGFGAFNAGLQSSIIQDTIRLKLSGSLNTITQPLSEEMDIFLQGRLPPSHEWREISFREFAIGCVAQLSSRVFLGEELARDPRWLKLAITYTLDAVVGARALRNWPYMFRPIVHWFLPETRKLRQDMAEATAIIDPILKQRRQVKAANDRKGIETPKYVDALQWMEDTAKGRAFPIINGQLLLSFASIHTTSGLLQSIMYDLCAYPEYIDLLREEIIAELGDQSSGWKKTSLHALKMMDSVMKESQRVNIVSLGKDPQTKLQTVILANVVIALIHRLVTEDVTLSDGTVIPKGALTTTPTADRMMDPSIWPDADKFIGRRFYDMRQQPGNENKGQFVTTSTNHYGFGHGSHACPGRFFASNETKIIFIHLLMKYDWKFPDGQERPRNLTIGHETMWDPRARVMVKPRKSEITFPGE